MTSTVVHLHDDTNSSICSDFKKMTSTVVHLHDDTNSSICSIVEKVSVTINSECLSDMGKFGIDCPGLLQELSQWCAVEISKKDPENIFHLEGCYYSVLKVKEILESKFNDAKASVSKNMPALSAANCSNKQEVGREFSSSSKESSLCEEQVCTDMQKLVKLVSKLNYDVVNVRDNGNCMFLALADQIGIKESDCDKIVRKNIVDYLTVHPALIKLENIDEQSITEYLDNMSIDTTWGDEIVLTAASMLFKRPIKIFLSDGNTINIGVEPLESTPILLGYVALNDQLGRNHYVSLQLRTTFQRLENFTASSNECDTNGDVSVNIKKEIGPSKTGRVRQLKREIPTHELDSYVNVSISDVAECCEHEAGVTNLEKKIENLKDMDRGKNIEVRNFGKNIKKSEEIIVESKNIEDQNSMRNSKETKQSKNTSNVSAKLLPFKIDKCSQKQCIFKSQRKDNVIIVRVIQNHIVNERADVLVNSDTSSASTMSGPGSILGIAGTMTKKDCQKKKSAKLKVGDVFETTTGNLNESIKHLLHVIAPCPPKFTSRDDRTSQALQQSFYKCFEYANRNWESASSLSVSPIGIDIFGVHLVAKAFVAALELYDSQFSHSTKSTELKIKNIRLVCADDKSAKEMIEAIKAIIG